MGRWAGCPLRRGGGRRPPRTDAAAQRCAGRCCGWAPHAWPPLLTVHGARLEGRHGQCSRAGLGRWAGCPLRRGGGRLDLT